MHGPRGTGTERLLIPLATGVRNLVVQVAHRAWITENDWVRAVVYAALRINQIAHPPTDDDSPEDVEEMRRWREVPYWAVLDPGKIFGPAASGRMKTTDMADILLSPKRVPARKGIKYSEDLVVHVLPGTKSLIERAAESCRMSQNEWLRTVIHAALRTAHRLEPYLDI